VEDAKLTQIELEEMAMEQTATDVELDTPGQGNATA
jgi:hypothetical protein